MSIKTKLIKCLCCESNVSHDLTIRAALRKFRPILFCFAKSQKKIFSPQFLPTLNFGENKRARRDEMGAADCSRGLGAEI